MALLDEESKLASATDKTLLAKLHQTCKPNKYYEQPRLSQDTFIVKHYAEPVSYKIDGFRTKNQNTIEETILFAVKRSQHPLMKKLFPEDSNTSDKKSTKQPTISSIFKSQLSNLKNTLDNTTPFYIRCVKPNHQQKAHCFDSEAVAKQLAYSGMVETVKIRALGFPMRYDFKEFLGKFKAIATFPKVSASSVSELMGMTKISKSLYQIGKSKIFLRTEGNDALEKLRAEKLKSRVIKIQAFFRMCRLRLYFVRARQSAYVIQGAIRVYRYNRRLMQMVVASIKIAEYMERMREDERMRAEEERLRQEEEEEMMRQNESAKEKKKREESERKRRQAEEREEAKKQELAIDALEPMREHIRKQQEEQRRKEIEKRDEEFEEMRLKRLAEQERAAEERQSTPIYEEQSEEVRTKLKKIDEIVVPESEAEIVKIAKALQLRVRGQKPPVADRLYHRAIELYKKAISISSIQDNYINCGTALINWANLKLAMPGYANKEEACVPHLDEAKQMLEKSIELGLDIEGKQAVQERLLKLEKLRQRILQEDLKNNNLQKREEKIEEISTELSRIKPVSMIGKLKKQGAGSSAFGRKSWKDRIFVLSDKLLKYHAKSTKEPAKGEIALSEIVSVNKISENNKEYCFTIATANRFYPVAALTQEEMNQWIKAIQTNVHRLKLVEMMESLSN